MKSLNHPDSCNCQSCRTRRWRLTEKGQRAVDRSNAKLQGRRQLVRLKKQTIKDIPQSFLNEISRHLSKGRDPSTIAVWMNRPMSIIQEAISKLTPPTP